MVEIGVQTEQALQDPIVPPTLTVQPAQLVPEILLEFLSMQTAQVEYTALHCEQEVLLILREETVENG